MKPDNKAGGPWLYALGLIPVVWFALLIAPSLSGGLSEIVNALPAAMNHPFQIVWCEDSVKTVLIFIAAYGLGIGIYLSSRRNYRRGEEHGSAKWGDPRAVNKKYRDRDPFKNRIFTQHVRMGLDGRKHRRNLNTLVVGGSGAGKSRFYAKVNLCQANTSYFILDCKGELLRDCGGLLEKRGYEIRVVDLLNMEKSHCYNPFSYLKSDNDVQKMVTNLFKASKLIQKLAKNKVIFVVTHDYEFVCLTCSRLIRFDQHALVEDLPVCMENKEKIYALMEQEGGKEI